MSQFLSTIRGTLVVDEESELWQLDIPLDYQCDLTGTVERVEQGFRTDFCSVPRVPGVYVLLGNRARKTGALHDWLYYTKKYPRDVCDKILLEALQVNGVNKFQAYLFYLGVRAGGSSHYGTNTKNS